MEETKNQGFTVIKTKDLDQTVEMLVSVTTELKIASTRGECDLLVNKFFFDSFSFHFFISSFLYFFEIKK